MKYYPFMDGFRGLAVLWVILHHASYHFGWDILANLPLKVVSKIADVGFLGVDVFFVISGFLITGLLLEDFDDGRIRLKRFYLRRFFKIIPQYFLILLTGIWLTALIPGLRSDLHRPFTIFSYFIFMQNYVASSLSVLEHTWSLAIEEHFYLCYPVILQMICLGIPYPNIRRKVLIGICLVLIVFFNVFRYCSAGPDFLSKSLHLFFYFHTTLYQADALVIGCLLKLLEEYYREKISIGWKIFSFFCFVTGIGIFSLIILNGFYVDAWYYYSLVYLACAMLLFAGSKGYDFFVRSNFLIEIGKNSYGIYLWHYIFLWPFLSFVRLFQLNPVNISVVGFCYIGAVIGAGILSTCTVEKYFLNMRKKIIP